MGLIKPFLLTLFVFVLTPALVVAADHGHGGDLDLGAMVVTAERIDEYVRNHPQQVERLDDAEIRSRNMLSVEEALGVMPGVEVKRSAGVGSRISIRGSGKSGGVLVLFNGRPLNSNQYGGVDLSAIPVEIVGSITVFKPPVPVWLGPGGSDGIINITTAAADPGRPRDSAPATRLRLAGGSYGLAQGSVSHRRPLAQGSVMLSANGSHRDGKRQNNDRDSGGCTLHWDRDLGGGRRLEIDGRGYLAENGSPGPLDNSTPDARQRYRKTSFDSRFSGLFGGAADYSLNLYGDWINLEDRSQSGYTASLDDCKLGLKGESSWEAGDGAWSLRFSGICERDEIDHSLSGEHHRVTAGLGAQLDRRFGAWVLTGGLRCDRSSDFDYGPGLSSGLSWSIGQGWMAKLNAGYSVKIPSFGQLFQPSHGSIDQVRGNPDLDEERIWSWDAAFEYRRDQEHRLQVTLFRVDTDDAIVYFRDERLIFQPVNADRCWRHGLELTAKWALGTNLSFDGSVIIQDSEIKDHGGELPYTPRVKIDLTFSARPPLAGLRWETTLRYCSRQYSESENDPAQRLDDYLTVDLKSVYPLKLQGLTAEWFVTVENLFDADFEIHYGYPDDGLRALTGLNLTF
ncbi:MAG TPA: TonB-dependent receptor [Proteobacteria bacterium]|nr:TonB-dependent receptor [Pseudomonadota bacterium]